MRKQLNQKQTDALLTTLKERFEKNMSRHKGIVWTAVEKKLKAQPEKLWSIQEMEASGGEPDLVLFNQTNADWMYIDCSAESPAGRRSLCYDKQALDERKEAKPKSSVLETAEAMGIDLLNETEYRALQELGHFDAKTSSWLKTPDPIRKRGGAIFGDYRYDHVFVYHNGASSYYAARGFRGVVKI
jgi:hypothetical protein